MQPQLFGPTIIRTGSSGASACTNMHTQIVWPMAFRGVVYNMQLISALGSPTDLTSSKVADLSACMNAADSDNSM